MCEQTRESVVNPFCAKEKPQPSIESVIRSEELLFRNTIERGRKFVASLKPDELTGEKLAGLHQTHGISPDVVEFILGRAIPEALHFAYAEAYEAHKATGKAGQKKVVLVAR